MNEARELVKFFQCILSFKKKSKNAKSPLEKIKLKEKSFPRQHASELGSSPQQRLQRMRSPEGLLRPVPETSPPYVLS